MSHSLFQTILLQTKLSSITISTVKSCGQPKPKMPPLYGGNPRTQRCAASRSLQVPPAALPTEDRQPARTGVLRAGPLEALQALPISMRVRCPTRGCRKDGVVAPRSPATQNSGEAIVFKMRSARQGARRAAPHRWAVNRRKSPLRGAEEQVLVDPSVWMDHGRLVAASRAVPCRGEPWRAARARRRACILKCSPSCNEVTREPPENS